MRILEWAAPSLVTHLAWGALLIRLFGASYTVLRAGTLAFALAALLLVYALGRRLALDPARALVASLLLAASPWWTSLAFTYMTDAPWLAMMLGALLLVAAAPRGQPLRLVTAGLLVGAAALSRQFAIVTAPAFALVLCLDARAAAPRSPDGEGAPAASKAGPARAWLLDGARRSLLFGAPIVLLYGAFHYWYTRVHLPTEANRDTLARMRDVSLSDPLFHALSAWHYLGLWLAPLAAAAVTAWLRRGTTSRRERARAVGLDDGGRRPLVTLALSLAALGALAGYAAAKGSTTIAAIRHPTMPYLGNLVWLVGVGPPTLIDVYTGRQPPPHAALWLGVLLTIVSTAAGAVVGLWLARALRLAAHTLRRDESPAAVDGPARVRVLLLGFAALYLGWHVATATFVFDRYLVVLLPVAALLAVDALPTEIARSPVALAGLALFAAAAVIGTREYLAWNGARHDAVAALVAKGVDPSEIDGGFEVNGPRCWTPPRARRCAFQNTWWGESARYRLSFWPTLPGDSARCRVVDRHPYFSFTSGRAIWTLDCAP